jgi:hypothetical protein
MPTGVVCVDLAANASGASPDARSPELAGLVFPAPDGVIAEASVLPDRGSGAAESVLTPSATVAGVVDGEGEGVSDAAIDVECAVAVGPTGTDGVPLPSTSKAVAAAFVCSFNAAGSGR